MTVVKRPIPFRETIRQAEARRAAEAEEGVAFREGFRQGYGAETWQEAFLGVMRRDPDWAPGELATAGLSGEEMLKFLMETRRLT